MRKIKKNFNLTAHFKLDEFERSVTASAHKIDNRVPDDLMFNLQGLAERLEIVRCKIGVPIVVSSGYRCERLNKLVGGVSNSFHTTAQAADIYPLVNCDNTINSVIYKDMVLQLRKLKPEELIDYGTFVHVAFKI